MLTCSVNVEYNAPMSAQLPFKKGMKMYAELKRRCYKCKIEKLLFKDFFRDSTMNRGYSYLCKSCKMAYNKEFIKIHPRKKRDRRIYEFKRGLRRNYKMTVQNIKTNVGVSFQLIMIMQQEK